jgi:uncharacterized membrane protein
VIRCSYDLCLSKKYKRLRKESTISPTNSCHPLRKSSRDFSTKYQELSIMDKRALVASALTALLAISQGAAVAQDSGKEKCYGVAKAGQNDCANLSDTHVCAGLSTLSDDAGEWKYVAKGTCKAMNGLSLVEAKANAAAMKKKK